MGAPRTRKFADLRLNGPNDPKDLTFLAKKIKIKQMDSRDQINQINKMRDISKSET